MHKVWKGAASAGASLTIACLLPAAAQAQAQKIHRCLVDGRTVFQQSACATPQPPTSNAVTASDPRVQACLAHLKPLLRNPASARVDNLSLDGSVLRLSLQATDARGTLRRRDVACEFAAGQLDETRTRGRLARLGWFQTLPPSPGHGPQAAPNRRAVEESMEAASPG